MLEIEKLIYKLCLLAEFAVGRNFTRTACFAKYPAAGFPFPVMEITETRFPSVLHLTTVYSAPIFQLQMETEYVKEDRIMYSVRVIGLLCLVRKNMHMVHVSKCCYM